MYLAHNSTTEPQSSEIPVAFNSIEHASMNYPVLCALFGILGLYGLCFLLVRRIRSKEHTQVGATVIPHRSYYRKPHYYFLLFYTGSGRYTGTTANVYCVIHGKQKKTKPIVLRDPKRLLFQSGTITSFLLTLNQSLNEITNVRLWHDISGPKPSWFLERVVICHLNTGIMWCFEGNRWLDVSEGETVECTLESLPRSRYLGRKALFDKTFAESFKNKHIWFSPFLVKCRTKFSRLERLATCLAASMTTVLMVTIIVSSTIDNDPFPRSAITLGPLEFHISDVLWGIISSVLPFLLRLMMEAFFTFSEGKQTLSMGDSDVQGYIDECLRKSYEITILEGQSGGSEENDEKHISKEDKELYSIDDTRRESILSSEWEHSLSTISLREVGLDLKDDVDNKTSVMASAYGIYKNNDVNKGEIVKIIDTVENEASTGDDNAIRDEEALHLKNNAIAQNTNIGLDEEGIGFNCAISNGDCKTETHSNFERQANGYVIVQNGKQTHKLTCNANTIAESTQSHSNMCNDLTNTDKLSTLWKMLPLPGFLIDQNCVRIRNEDRSLKLERKYLYIAITICVLSIFISTIVSLRCGFYWSFSVSISWLIIIALAHCFQMFVVESFFMFFQSVYFAIILKRPTEENDVINEQKNKIWSKEDDEIRYYVDDLDDTGSSVPSPPTEEEVQKARKKAGQDRQLEEVLAMVAFDVLFLVQLIIIGFGNRDVECYPTRVVVENNYNIPKFNLISNSKGFWNWTKNDLVAGLYYQGQFKQKDSRQTRDGYGTLLGVPILRQQRIKPNGI